MVEEWLRTQSFRLGETRLVCPSCSASRKGANRKLRELAVRNDGEKVVFHCWHCDLKGGYSLNGSSTLRRHSAVRPLPVRDSVNRAPQVEVKEMGETARAGAQISELTKEVSDWLLKERGISKETAFKYGLKSAVARRSEPAVAFPYFNQHGKVCGYKIRSIHDKRNMLVVGSLFGFFGQHIASKQPDDPLNIVEGEIDVLALAEAGVQNPISVPNGAPSGPISDNDDARLRCLNEAADLFKGRKKINLAGDMDEPGKILMQELARRLKRARCYMVEWPDDCKDGDDTLLKHGHDAVCAHVNDAKPIDIPGLYEAGHFKSDLIRLRRGEVGKGYSTGFQNVDELFQLSDGVLTVVTGLPSSGKSSLVDAIHINAAEEHGWMVANFSAENPPHYHIAKLIEKRARKRFYSTMKNVMTDDEMEEAYEFVSKHFKFLTVGEEPSTIDNILDRLSAAVLRYGIKGAVIDPYNYIAPPDTMAEHLHISHLLSKSRTWAQNHGVHLFLVAHPTKITTPGLVPMGEHISGGAAWRAKADFGLTVHRVRESTISEVHCWKVRYEHLGREGQADLEYNIDTACYEETITPYRGPQWQQQAPSKTKWDLDWPELQEGSSRYGR